MVYGDDKWGRTFEIRATLENLIAYILQSEHCNRGKIQGLASASRSESEAMKEPHIHRGGRTWDLSPWQL